MKHLLILILILITSCNDTKKVKGNLNYNHELVTPIQTTIKMIQDLELDYARNIIMVSSTNRERTFFINTIQEIETILFILLNKPSDSKALERLYQRIKKFNQIPLQRRDLEFITPLKKQLMPILSKVARYQNISKADIHWRIFNESFDSGFNLFTTSSNGLSWRAQERNRVSYVSTSGKAGDAWLITPLINLKDIDNPAFRINYVVNNRGNLNDEYKGFEVFVSEEYEFGSPEEINWEKIKLPNFNITNSFSLQWSPKLSLSRYLNKTISIAFKFTKEANQNIVAQINDFQLFGALLDESADDESFILKRKDPTRYLFKHSFSEGLNGFTQESEGASPSEFKLVERNGSTYVQINSFDDKNSGVTFLESPIIVLGSEEYAIQIEQSINFYKQPAKDNKYIQVLYTLVDGTSEDNWQVLNFKSVPTGENWDIVKSEWLNLPFKNQKIKIAFRYESGTVVKEYPNWQLHNLNIKVVE